MNYKIGVLGAGTWGMALAQLLAKKGYDVNVWSALDYEIDEYSTTRRHPNLPEMTIAEEIKFTKQIEEICKEKDLLLFAVPSSFVRKTAELARPYIMDGQVIVDVAKGIEADTLYTMTEVIRNELQKDNLHDQIKVAALSGPTHAEEVSINLPTTIVSACDDLETAKMIQDIFMTDTMRVYTNPDMIGVEICGALKNVIALASGISTGLGYGDNARAALITRGMAEITRLGVAMGCMRQTFNGLAGIGDLIVTATSMHSRNNKAGILIGKGYSPAEAVKEVGMVVEGINALPAAINLSKRYRVEMPLVNAVNSVINEEVCAKDAVRDLMIRDKKDEYPLSEFDIQNNNERQYKGEKSGMKRVITYGTFDLLHYGHINLLKRAKALGDYLVVALSTDEFNWEEKQKKCYFSYEQRKALLESIRYVDLVIPENNWEQKKTDVHDYHIDTFVIGDDWKGKFDFLKDEGVEVVYLARTPEISSTRIKKDLHQK